MINFSRNFSNPTCRFLFIAVLTFITGTGCVAGRDGDAPADYLKQTAWLEPDDLLRYNNFSEYADSARQLVEKNRVPFDSTQALHEVDVASPVEILPSSECAAGHAKGIAILVHGLSDTAYAMRDLARVFSQRCYIARTVLLPGHGTRPGDLLGIRLGHWLKTVRHLTNQAASEHENVVLGGFSLGAVLTLSVALEEASPVKAVLAFSPAYTLSSYRLARLSPWLHWAKKWIDRGLPDDYARYEAMPTRGVAETVRAMHRLRSQVKKQAVSQPWLLVQSMDDAVTVPTGNINFQARYGNSPLNRTIVFYSDPGHKFDDPTIEWIPGNSESLKVQGLTHLGVHISPENPHYGPNGDYRNCGQTAPREPIEVTRCLESDDVWYGLWNRPAPPNVASARNSFNPRFNSLAEAMGKFLDSL